MTWKQFIDPHEYGNYSLKGFFGYPSFSIHHFQTKLSTWLSWHFKSWENIPTELFVSFQWLLTCIKQSLVVYCVLLSRFWITLLSKLGRTTGFPRPKCKTLKNKPGGARDLQNAVGIKIIGLVINSENRREFDGISSSLNRKLRWTTRFPRPKCKTLKNKPTGAVDLQNAFGIKLIRRVVNSGEWREKKDFRDTKILFWWISKEPL